MDKRARDKLRGRALGGPGKGKLRDIRSFAGGSAATTAAAATQRRGHGLERPLGRERARRLPGALHPRAAKDASQGQAYPGGHQALVAALHF